MTYTRGQQHDEQQTAHDLAITVRHWSPATVMMLPALSHRHVSPATVFI